MEDGSIYILQEVPDKGKGLVATQDIPKGTRILLERPVVSTPEGQRSDRWLKRYVSQQVHSLNECQRRSLLSMHNLYPYKDDAEQFMGIFRTNALPIEANNIGGGLFLEACRINHSCDNNAQKYWNQRIERHTVYALRKIPKGEEITIYYLGLDSIREVRRKKLQAKFGFLCSCRICSLPTAESQENDRRLEKIHLLDKLVGRECMSMNFSLPVLRHVDEIVQLYNKQGPGDPGLPRAYLDAAQIAIANGDLARGRVFAERAVEGYRVAQGTDSEEVIEYTSLAQDPAKLPLYGISMKWKTSLAEVPLQLESNEFEDWLWRREGQKKIHKSGHLTSLRNRDIFPDFTALPYSNSGFLGFHRGPEEPYQSSHHWCFLGEITDSATLHHLELELADVDDKRIPLHFNTPDRGSGVAIAQIQKGYTAAVLYAERHTFTYGDPGIKLVDPQMFKIFPISLNKLLDLSDRIQQFSGDSNGIRTCHGCSKKAALSNHCGRCSFFWYCNNACQKTGWVERGHKTDCKLLKDSDLRGLFTLRWDKLDTRTQFPLALQVTD